MINLTMQCSRCGKEVSHDMTNQTLNDDLVRKFGFSYAHDGNTNVLICTDCEKKFNDLKVKLNNLLSEQVCGFFDNCGEEKEDGKYRGPNNG